MFLLNCNHVKYKFSPIKHILLAYMTPWFLPKKTGLWCLIHLAAFSLSWFTFRLCVLILWTVWHHTAQAPPTTANRLSHISISSVMSSAGCMLSAIFSVLELLMATHVIQICKSSPSFNFWMQWKLSLCFLSFTFSQVWMEVSGAKTVGLFLLYKAMITSPTLRLGVCRHVFGGWNLGRWVCSWNEQNSRSKQTAKFLAAPSLFFLISLASMRINWDIKAISFMIFFYLTCKYKTV